MSMSQARAEVIGLKALSWLAGHDDLLPVFLGSTGAAEEDFRERIEDVEFLGSILEFIVMDDAWIAEFCAAENLPMDVPYQARMALPGGASVHWT